MLTELRCIKPYVEIRNNEEILLADEKSRWLLISEIEHVTLIKPLDSKEEVLLIVPTLVFHNHFAPYSIHFQEGALIEKGHQMIADTILQKVRDAFDPSKISKNAYDIEVFVCQKDYRTPPTRSHRIYELAKEGSIWKRDITTEVPNYFDVILTNGKITIGLTNEELSNHFRNIKDVISTALQTYLEEENI